MALIRTTLRLKENLKKTAERKAVEEDTTLQEIFNRALESYIYREGALEAKEIIFKTHDLGEPLDNLKRKDFHSLPK